MKPSGRYSTLRCGVVHPSPGEDDVREHGDIVANFRRLQATRRRAADRNLTPMELRLLRQMFVADRGLASSVANVDDPLSGLGALICSSPHRRSTLYVRQQSARRDRGRSRSALELIAKAFCVGGHVRLVTLLVSLPRGSVDIVGPLDRDRHMETL